MGGSPISAGVERDRPIEVVGVQGHLMQDHLAAPGARSLIHTANNTRRRTHPVAHMQVFADDEPREDDTEHRSQEHRDGHSIGRLVGKHQAQQQIGDRRADPEEDRCAQRLGCDRVTAHHATVEHIEEARGNDEDQGADLGDGCNGQRVDAAPDTANERRVHREGDHGAEQQDDRKYR